MATNLFTTTATDWGYGYNTIAEAKFDTYGMSDIPDKANDFMRELARVAIRMRKQNLYERSEVNRTDCFGMFGADDVARHTKEYTTTYPIEYPRYSNSAAYTYVRSRQAYYFYSSLRVIAQYFYGHQLSSSVYPFTITATSLTADDYNQCFGPNDKKQLGINFSEFWRNPRGTGEKYASATVNGLFNNDADSVWCGDTVWKSSSQSNRQKAVLDFLNTIVCFVKYDQLQTELCTCLPTAQGGDGESANDTAPTVGDYFTQDYAVRATKFFTLLPCVICQVRQLLAKVMLNPNYGTDAWQPWEYSGQVQCSIAVQNGLSERGILNAIIPDKTIDPNKSSIYSTPVSDPLVVAGTGYGIIADADGDLAHLAPVVSLRRQYMFRRYCSYYDYPEADNSNAFEQKYGRVRYGQSNLHQWLNSVKTGAGGWAVNTHDADAFAGTAKYAYGYLNHISNILRGNLAKIEYLYPSGNANAIVNNTCAVAFTNDWVAIPNMTQFGYSNYSGTRKTARIAVDDVVHGEYYFLGEYGEIEYGNSSYCAEDNWRPAMTSHQYHKFAYNPNFAAQTATTLRRCPSRTPANSASDNYDATIANLVAAMYSDDDGANAPTKTTSQPWFVEDGLMVYFTVAAFHAEKIDPSLPVENLYGPTLTSN